LVFKKDRQKSIKKNKIFGSVEMLNKISYDVLGGISRACGRQD
jgi:hypothetical protein